MASSRAPTLPLSPVGVFALGAVLVVALVGCKTTKTAEIPDDAKPVPVVIEEDPNAPLPYPAAQLPASRLLGQSQASSWTPLPPYSEERATESMGELITRFSRRADLHRRSSKPGRKPPQMSALQGQNWREFLAELDELMVRVPASTFENELLRAQRTLETELEADAAVYAEIPASIVDAVLERETKFGLRAMQLSRSQKRDSRVTPYGVSKDEWDSDSVRPWRDPGSGFYTWPVSPVKVTSLFGRRFHPIHKTYRAHQGLDLQARTGHELWAAADGRVIRASYHGSHGNHVEIKHSNGDVTGYSHMSKIMVKVGATVVKGQRIGLSGMTGGATGPHLHFEIWRDGTPLDPLSELGDPPEEGV